MMMDYVFLKKNIIYSALLYLVSNSLKFIVRFFFVKSLPIEFLGINGLLSNVLALLSFAELGIGSAIVYSLYKPIAENDKNTIIAIMRLYKKLYSAIGLVIIIIGVLITPYLDWFIRDNNIKNLSLYYVIFVFNMGLSYFFAYKRDLIVAHQKQYINNIYKIRFQVILAVLQILSLVYLNSYLVYILLMLIMTITENYYVSQKASKMFSYIQNDFSSFNIIREDIKENIIRNIKALILNRIGNIVITASPSLIISKLIGLKVLGIYSNYYMILFAVNSFTANLFGSVVANIGNLMIEESDSKKIKVFRIVYFIIAFQNAVICCGFFVLLNPLIELWLNKNFLFDELVVNLLVINFYINYMRRCVLTFREAAGLYWQDRYKSLLESIIFVIFALILQRQWGINGVIASLILSTLLTSFWIEPYILFKGTVKMKLLKYYSDYFKFTLITIISSYISRLIYINFFVQVNTINFLCGVFLCIVITVFFWIFVFYNREEMQFIIKLTKNKINRNKIV